ncbi:hypothetical protein PR048_030459 [Dryococelus australis]|uniref:Peptidase S1 domain-containing protein n=1 Tax=Dryococelus australis TaxID=614101 RepID=A0ABQ9GBW7_9NEOP|nr:hypothetical protein PR048_030459 [Dryococelus australis]
MKYKIDLIIPAASIAIRAGSTQWNSGGTVHRVSRYIAHQLYRNGSTDHDIVAIKGDSGGPLMLDGRQVGIMSWIENCIPTNMPAVYTRVSHYRDWISKTTGI